MAKLGIRKSLDRAVDALDEARYSAELTEEQQARASQAYRIALSLYEEILDAK